MYNRIVFLSYIKNSETLNLLTEVLPRSIVVKHNKRFYPEENDVIVFWGSAKEQPWLNDNIIEDLNLLIINSPNNIKIASNKLLSFLHFKRENILTPNFAINKYSAANLSRPIYVRHNLHGHSGDGIEIIKEGDGLPEAHLYVEGIQKEKEYRVHVFGDGAIKFSRKIARKTAEYHDEYVWSHNNGYYFNKVKNNIEAGKVAIEAVKSLGLIFGAADVILFNEKYYVLEVNTAPGMQNGTIEAYKNKLLEYIEQTQLY
jgi:glutathione synthase/RimK-type ligase-like ATP-grasp enzyme